MQQLACSERKNLGWLANEWALRLFACEESPDCREISCPLYYIVTDNLAHRAFLARL